MSDITLRPCPFCGQPWEIYIANTFGGFVEKKRKEKEKTP